MSSVRIDFEEAGVAFALQVTEERGRWTASRDVPESYFPLVVELGGRRFELYSDGTFSEEYVKNAPSPQAGDE